MTTNVGVVDPVEILLNLVKDGKRDAWDIDIIEVTDEFLAELDRIGQHDPLLLARSARCLFYASALVHLKAQALNDPAILYGNQQDDWDDEFDYDDGPLERLELPLFYPKAGTSLVPRERRPRGRSLTLDDLLDALRRLDVEALTAEPEYEDYDDPWDVPFDEDIADIPTAHEDDLEGDILKIREDLRDRFEEGQKELSLEEVRGEMTRGEAFLALLFLAHDGEVDFQQDEFYGELTVTPGPEPLKEITEEEKSKREAFEKRREEAREKREEKRKDRGIPRPRKRRRRMSRRPGLAPSAASRRPRSRPRGPRAGLRQARDNLAIAQSNSDAPTQRPPPSQGDPGSASQHESFNFD